MLNTVILQGRLCADPEVKYTQNNIAVVSLRVACDRDYRNDNGTAQADFINIVAWRKTAEFVAKYFNKGSMILVEGRLQIRDYTDRDGNKRYATEVVADRVNFCGSKRDKPSQSNAAPTNYQDYASATGYSSAQESSNVADFSELADEDGELPF